MKNPVLILVDIAHADSAVHALKHANDVFSAADLHVAYVMPYGFYSYVEPFVSEESQKAAATRAKTKLAAVIEKADMTDSTTPHVLRGGIGEQCLRLAEKLDASVIVLNAARHGSAHVTLGTHAAQIARHAKSSVHLVREGAL